MIILAHIHAVMSAQNKEKTCPKSNNNKDITANEPAQSHQLRNQ